MQWRELINRYLLACQEDQRAALRSKTSVQQIFMSCGSSKLKESIAVGHAKAEQRSRQSLSPLDSYILIQETPDLIVADVDSDAAGHPPLKSRFRVIRQGDVWLLDGIYWKCHCEDGKCFSCDDGSCKQCSRGKCSWCNGSGTNKLWFFLRRRCILCDGTGSCLICEGKGSCNCCEGAGKCTSCSGSDMPGWFSIYFDRQTVSTNKA